MKNRTAIKKKLQRLQDERKKLSAELDKALKKKNKILIMMKYRDLDFTCGKVSALKWVLR